LEEIDGYDRRFGGPRHLQPEFLLQSLSEQSLYAENFTKSTTGALPSVYP